MIPNSDSFYNPFVYAYNIQPTSTVQKLSAKLITVPSSESAVRKHKCFLADIGSYCKEKERKGGYIFARC